MNLTREQLRELWANGKSITYNKRPYLVHRMSYGDYFIEPTNWPGGERDGFSPLTKWFELVDVKKQLFELVD